MSEIINIFTLIILILFFIIFNIERYYYYKIYNNTDDKKKSLLNFNPTVPNSNIDLYNDINSNNQNKSHL